MFSGFLHGLASLLCRSLRSQAPKLVVLVIDVSHHLGDHSVAGLLGNEAVHQGVALEVEPVNRFGLNDISPLKLVVVLGHAPTSIRHVLSLNVGDVLRLEEAPTAALQVYVEGQKKMLGTPVVSHGNIAVEVIEVLKGAP